MMAFYDQLYLISGNSEQQLNMHNPIDDTYVLIRSVGERTEQACLGILRQVFLEENIVIVRRTPFSESIRESFDLAMRRGLPWSLCIDADVLVDVEQLHNLLQKALEADERIFEVQGLVLDKFFPIWRPAGNHLYRTSLMGKALTCIPEEGLSLRPESDMLISMSEEGYPCMQCDIKLGIHDFEQYYEDIYRKSFLQAHKHSLFVPILESYWSERVKVDEDFVVALMGLRAGKSYQNKMYVDKQFLLKKIRAVFQKAGIMEKVPISGGVQLTQIFNDIEITCADHKEIQETVFPYHRWNTISPSGVFGGIELKEAQLEKYGFKLWTHPQAYFRYAESTNEEFLSDLVNNLVKNVQLFVDVGACHGYYSFLVKKSNPACKVIAIEPVNENIEVLKLNLRSNDVSDVVLLKTVGSDDGNSPHFVSGGTNKSGLVKDMPWQVREMGVSLFDILQQHAGQSVLIRIDANEFGLNVLDGILPELQIRDDVRLIIEVFPENFHLDRWQQERLDEKLESIGYDIFIVNRENSRFSRLQKGNSLELNKDQKVVSLICIKKSRSSNVVFFSHSGGLGGAERSLIDLVGQLIQDHGVLCTVYLPEGPSCQRLRDLGASVVYFNVASWCELAESSEDVSKKLDKKLKISTHALFCSIDDLKIISPDVICTNTLVVPWGALAAMIINKPHFWMVNEYGEADHNLKFLFPFEEVLKFIERHSNMIVTRSKALQYALFGNSSNRNIETIYRNIHMPSRVSTMLTAEDPTLRIFFPGRINPSKGQKDAIIAALRILEQGSDIELVLAGDINDPIYFDDLLNLINKTQFKNKITFLPFRENISLLYKDADVVLVCSKNEAFGRVILEAMMMGKVVIAADSGGNREMIQDGVTGLFYEPGNVEQLSVKIMQIYSDRELGRIIGNNALEFASKTFRKENFGGRYYSLFIQYKGKNNMVYNVSDRWIIDLYVDEWFSQSRASHLLSNQLAERDAQLAELETQLEEIRASKIWTLGLWLRRLRLWLFPANSVYFKIGKSVFGLVQKIKNKK